MKAEVTHCLIEIAPAILATDLLISFFATPEVSFYILVTNMLILAPNWAYLNPRLDQKLGCRIVEAFLLRVFQWRKISLGALRSWAAIF